MKLDTINQQTRIILNLVSKMLVARYRANLISKKNLFVESLYYIRVGENPYSFFLQTIKLVNASRS